MAGESLGNVSRVYWAMFHIFIGSFFAIFIRWVAGLSSANRALCGDGLRIIGLTYVGCGISCTIVDNVSDHSLSFIYLRRRSG